MRNSYVSVLAAFGGPLVWATQFGVVYATNATACARGFANTMLLGLHISLVTTLAATVIAGAAIVLLWLAGEAAHRSVMASQSDNDPSSDELLHFLSRWLNGVSLLAVLWTAVPALIVDPCA
jgi:hypothetical protein